MKFLLRVGGFAAAAALSLRESSPDAVNVNVQARRKLNNQPHQIWIGVCFSNDFDYRILVEPKLCKTKLFNFEFFQVNVGGGSAGEGKSNVCGMLNSQTVATLEV